MSSLWPQRSCRVSEKTGPKLMCRTLGKKIVMEDDMNETELKISGAEVKRMGSRGVLR